MCNARFIIKVRPKGIQKHPKCTKMEPSWVPHWTKVASRWSKNSPGAAATYPSLTIRRLSSRPKLTFIFHVETNDPHPPPHRFWVPPGSPK